jgi:hypothetical protein
VPSYVEEEGRSDMSTMDDQGHLPADVEPGRRTGPEANDVLPDGRPDGARLHDEDGRTAMPVSHREPPFEPADDGMRISDTEYENGREARDDPEFVSGFDAG